jgi:hypothetical protein
MSGFIDPASRKAALTPATAARLGALADQLDAEALGRLPFASGELAEALAQGNAVRALVRLAGGKEGQLSAAPARTVGDLLSERNPLIGGIISAYLGEEA